MIVIIFNIKENKIGKNGKLFAIIVNIKEKTILTQSYFKPIYCVRG